MIEQQEIVLWADARYCSPWVLIVWVALKEKNIPFKVQALDLQRGEHRAGDYPKQILTAKVPAVCHGELWVAESLAILEYLEETFRPPTYPQLLPTDIAARARDRQILSWLRSDLSELRRCMPYEGIFLPIEVPELTAKALEEADKLLLIAQARVRSTPRSSPTLADYELAFTMRRLIHYRHDLREHRDVVEFSDAIWSRSSVLSWLTQAGRQPGAR